MNELFSLKKTHYLLWLFFLSVSISAQIKVTGKIVDKENFAIEFAEINIISKDSTILKSELSNEKGYFEIDANLGFNKLQIRQTNKVVYSKTMELTENLNLGTIIINNINQLKSIVVQGKRKLIERKVDRLVFNVENAVNATGTDALETLKITPGVKVQNDNITIIGKSNLSVMIDDKIIQLSGDDLANFLKSIPSDNIKNIEVITTPPAKYEAQGNSGLVNIKLKKARKNSWNALLGTSYLQRTYRENAFNGSFNYNKNKLEIASSFNIKDGRRYVAQDDYAYFDDGLWYTSSPFVTKYTRRNLKISTDYQATNIWKIGGQVLYNKANRGDRDSPYTPVFDYVTNNVNRYLKSDSSTDETPNIQSFNLFNEIKLDTIGKRITVDLDYFNVNNQDVKFYKGVSVINFLLPFSKKYFAGNNNNTQDITNLSAKVDVDFPTKFAVLTFGGKLSNSNSKNKITFFNSGIVDNEVVDLPLAENKFEYKENVQGVYLSGNKKINEKWEAQFGIRMEATQTKTFAENLNQVVTNQYVKFFPSAYLSYVANDNSTFSLSYSKRIDRPSFELLNPNVVFINPFQVIDGNPFLQPAFVDNFEVTYTYKKLENKFYYSFLDNVFSQVPVADPVSKFIRFTNKNYIQTQLIGISENYVFDKFKWWSSNNAIDFNYAISKSNLIETAREQKGFNSRISTSNDFNLNINKTLVLNASYWYSFPGIDNIFYNAASSSTSLAIQYFLMSKDLKITLRGNDFFRNEVTDASATVNNIRQRGVYKYDPQGFLLAVNFKFGNKKIKVEQRSTGNEDERNRTGN